ncbi:hypothetical protein MC885_016023 [Smutsia gigantea]|nr:hypothetical protein MC885_016023 [Smutsia gigantea]
MEQGKGHPAGDLKTKKTRQHCFLKEVVTLDHQAEIALLWGKALVASSSACRILPQLPILMASLFPQGPTAVPEMLVDPAQVICGTVPMSDNDGVRYGRESTPQDSNVQMLTGSLHGAQDGELPCEQGNSLGVPQVRTPKPDPSILEAHPCDTSGPLLTDILHLDEHNGTHPEQYICGCGTNLHQHQKEQLRDKHCRSDERRPSFVMNSSVRMAEHTSVGSEEYAESFKYHSKLITLERSLRCSHWSRALMSTGSVGNCLATAPHSIRHQEDITLEEGLLSAVAPLHIRDFSVENDLMSATDMGTCSAKTLISFGTKKFTPERVLQMGKDFSQIEVRILQKMENISHKEP